MTSNHSTNWTAEEHAETLKLIAEGVRVTEIAARLGRNEATIRRHTRGIRKAPPRAHWTPEERRRAIEMSRDGVEYRAIGEALGRTEKSVESYLRSVGELRITGIDEETR